MECIEERDDEDNHDDDDKDDDYDDNHHKDDKDDDCYDNYHRSILCITRAADDGHETIIVASSALPRVPNATFQLYRRKR